MGTLNRRAFLTSAAAAAVLSAARAYGAGRHFALGLELYSVRNQMKTDLEGTIRKAGELGYTVVEASAMPVRKAAEVRKAFDNAGVTCPATHRNYADLRDRLSETLDYDAELGAKFVVCSSPLTRSGKPLAPHTFPTLDDWHFTADTFNELGEKMAAHGVKLGMHNHVAEFAVVEEITPWFELMRLTDPAKVSFELDCGWARVAGHDPVDLIRRYPNRIRTLHVKDFKLPEHPSPEKREAAKVVELGLGDIHYGSILAEAAKTPSITDVFVEQEEFTMPWPDALKTDAAYFRGLRY